MQLIHKTALIRCPHCGATYLPGEIYLPGELIGQPTDVVRDALGKIIYEDYDEKAPNSIETYYCEYCDKPFVVEASLTFNSYEELPEKDFSDPYVSLI